MQTKIDYYGDTEISKMNATELAQYEAEMLKDQAERDPARYSWPVHQERAIAKRRKELLQGSGVLGNEI